MSECPMKLISVVIVTYNSEELIDDCLNSLFQYNDIGDGLEVIIVDNCSRNSVPFFQRINQLYPDVITIMNKDNTGYGQGNNVGIMAAKSSIVMIMNPDVRLIAPIFKMALKYYSLDNELVLLGMQQLKNVSMKSISYSYDWLQSNVFTMFFDEISNKFNVFFPRLQYISGACFLIRKREFEQIDLFDERIFMYGEEVDVKRRLHKRFGFRSIRYTSKLSYIHLIHGRQTSFNSFKRSLDSLMYLCTKYDYDLKNCLKRQKRILQALLHYYKFKKNNDKVAYFSLCVDELNHYIKCKQSKKNIN